ncbi:MAG: 30S ribosomal protein S6 [Chlorobi bacterium]|nr:30S ribosomal protein S6 [Chlorobiota bacterium]
MEKRFYETTFIVNSSLDDDHIDNIIKSVEDMITKAGGTIVSTERIGRRRLAYPIAKRNNGYYVSLEYELADPSLVAKMERTFHHNEDILRALTLTLSPREVAAKHNRQAEAAMQTKQAEPASTQNGNNGETPAAVESDAGDAPSKNAD